MTWAGPARGVRLGLKETCWARPVNTARRLPELLDPSPAGPAPPPAKAASCPRPEPSRDVLLRTLGPRRPWV